MREGKGDDKGGEEEGKGNRARGSLKVPFRFG